MPAHPSGPSLQLVSVLLFGTVSATPPLQSGGGAPLDPPSDVASEERYIRCPKGSFLQGADRVKAETALLALHRRRKALGWAPLPSPTGNAYAARGFADWSSSVTLKPPWCASSPTARRMPDAWATPAYMRYVFDSPGSGARVEALSNFKAASETMIEYWGCEANATRGGSVTYPSAAACDAGGTACVATMPVRDPAERLVSAMLEILQRIANNNCPLISCPTCPAVSMPCFGEEAERAAAARDAASWFRHVTFDTAGVVRVAEGAVPALLADFMADLSCSKHVYASEHLLTQSAFAGDASGGLDVPVSVDDLEGGLDRVAASANFTRRCAVRAENVGAAKPGALPTKAELMAALGANVSLRQAVCDVYAQDYVCFGQPLLQGCEPILGR